MLRFNMIFNDYFKTSKYSDISTQIIEFKILDNSELIFQALKTSPVLLTSVASATSLASTASTASTAQCPHKTS
jgi:hypothetical protein